MILRNVRDGRFDIRTTQEAPPSVEYSGGWGFLHDYEDEKRKGRQKFKERQDRADRYRYHGD